MPDDKQERRYYDGDLQVPSLSKMSEIMNPFEA